MKRVYSAQCVQRDSYQDKGKRKLCTVLEAYRIFGEGNGLCIHGRGVKRATMSRVGPMRNERAKYQGARAYGTFSMGIILKLKPLETTEK